MASEIIYAEDLNLPALDIFGRLTENQLFHYFEPEPGLFMAESEKVVRRAIDAGYMPYAFLIETRILEDTRELYLPFEAPVYTMSMENIIELTGSHPISGVICAMRRRPMMDTAALCAGARRIAVLENVDNPTNIGALFRAAAALSVDGVILTEGSGDPLYRRSARVSMGTVFQIPWVRLDKKRRPWLRGELPELKARGFHLVGMALSGNTISLENYRCGQEEKLAILLGNEAEGLTAGTMENCDTLVKIPMAAGVDSLNVSAAGAVVFWALRYERT